MGQAKHDSNTVYYFSDATIVGCFSLSLPPSADSVVNKTSWSNPRQTRICYIFRLWVIINALLKKMSLYLLLHFRIRIIMLTCPASLWEICRNHVCLQNHTNHNKARPILFQLKSSLPFSLFLLMWSLESTTTKSFLRHLHCRGSPLFKSYR